MSIYALIEFALIWFMFSILMVFFSYQYVVNLVKYEIIKKPTWYTKILLFVAILFISPLILGVSLSNVAIKEVFKNGAKDF